MKIFCTITILCVCLVGCGRPVDNYIAGWDDMGAMLPDADQIKVFRDDFDAAHSSLRKALSHSDDSVRMRAAFVIREIGAIAKPAGDDLLSRFTEEPDALVRIYIVDALNAIGHNTDATISALSEHYEGLDGTSVAPNEDYSYAEVDEKIKIASALYSLSDAKSKRKYYDFVAQWLDPPGGNLDGELLDGYWERRWIAVNSLEQMATATDAIPKLESLQAESGAKPWVNTHVPRVLAVLRENAQ
jgi:hypothetical protein